MALKHIHMVAQPPPPPPSSTELLVMQNGNAVPLTHPVPPSPGPRLCAGDPAAAASNWDHAVFVLLCLAFSGTVASSWFLHAGAGVRVPFVLRLNNVPLCVWAALSLSVYPDGQGLPHPGTWAVPRDRAVLTPAHTPAVGPSEHIPGRGVAGSRGNSA